MPKNINTPRSELICGKLDSLDDELMRLGLTSLLYLSADIRRDAERMEMKLVSRKVEVSDLESSHDYLGGYN